jgi:uncharacterized protein YggU (UPF0235/DUF167 family)
MRLSVRVKPGSSRTGVGGEHDGALVIRVTARAVDGQATEAALRALADALGVRRSDVSLVTGAASRTKLVDVGTAAQPEDALAERVRSLRHQDPVPSKSRLPPKRSR